MKKLILTLAALLLLTPVSRGGEITAGSVPGTLNYQGRLERDNAPITGIIHLYFRVYNSATAVNTGGAACGAVFQPCLWESSEITVQATQGIFSVDLTPPLSVLSRGQQLYIEVQVESDTLSPREPLNSVAYALVAKRLEDGANVGVSTLTAAYTVNLATASGAYLTVGTSTQAASARLTVDGWLKLTSGGIIFPDNSSMNIASIASAGNISNPHDALVQADADSDDSGDVVFRKPLAVLARITNAGNMGIGTDTPSGKLDVDGAFYVGNEGIYDRDDTAVNVKEDLVVEGGRVTGVNADEYLSIGETDNVIALHSGGSERMRVHSDGKVGVGLSAPTANLHVAGDVLSNAGVRGGNVSIGSYAGSWNGLANEVRAAESSHLLLQQSNSYNVGIGTNTPREKLHVRGSVRSDYGVIAATGAFSGNVSVDGNFTANSGLGNMVYLSSTVVYGDLTVTGRVGSEAGFPAYLASTQSFTGLNTFLGQVTVSSDITTSNRLGAGVYDFDFPGTRYLQVGDNKVEFANDDAKAYLVAGSNADAVLNFYRGAAQAASLRTQGGANLGLVIGGSTKTLTDATYHRIQNSVVWVSTGYNTTPAIFVSSWMGNVGMGTSVMDPNWKLTVQGNIRLQGTGSAIIFPDGTSMATSSAASANSVSANGDAIVQSNADLSGGGDVLLRAGSLDGLILNSGGNVGIGTLNPVSRLNVRGGDLVLGTPYNPYGSDSVEDLVVGGNIAFEGALVQRSAQPVEFSGLIVSGDVFLSTGASANTGIGTASPGAKFDVEGDAQFGVGAAKSGFSTGGALTLATQLTVPNGGTGAATLASGAVLYGNGTSAVGTLPLLGNGGLFIGDGSGAPSTGTIAGTTNRITVTNGAGTITLNLPQDIHTGASPQFSGITLSNPTGVTSGGTGLNTVAQGDILFGSALNTLSALGKDTNATRYLSNTGTSNNPAWAQVSLTQGVSGILPAANGGTGANLSAETIGAIPYFSAAGVMNGLNAGTQDYLLQANGAAAPSWVRSTASNVNDTIVRRNGSGDFSAHDVTVNKLTASNIDGSVSGGASYIYENMNPGDDYIRVRGVLPTDNDGYLEIATANNGDEPIYVRQYSDYFATVSRQAKLLDESGNSSFPGTVSASAFSGPLTCTNCITLTSGSEVTGTLPFGNGGTGSTSIASGLVKSNGTVLSGGNSVTLTSEVSGTLPFGNGGTGSTSIASGLVKSNGSALSGGNSVTLTSEVSGTLPAGNGGTGQSSYTTGDILYASGASALSRLAGAASGNALISGGAGVAPSYGKIGLTTHVSGTLAFGNGGTGATSIASGLVKSNGSALSGGNNVDLTAEVTGNLPAGNGGTGRGTLTSGSVLVGNGTSAVTLVAGASGTQVFTVARTTTTTGTPCNDWTFTNGILVSVGADKACP